jgi:hypothetical protein
MKVTIKKNDRKQKSVRLNEDERRDLHTVAKCVLGKTESDAVAIIFSEIAKEYRKNKDSKELIIKIEMG